MKSLKYISSPSGYECESILKLHLETIWLNYLSKHIILQTNLQWFNYSSVFQMYNITNNKLTNTISNTFVNPQNLDFQKYM